VILWKKYKRIWDNMTKIGGNQLIAKFFQNPILRPVWLILRVWLGIQWFNAGYHKLIDPTGVWVGPRAGVAIKGFPTALCTPQL
jgi:hypothetical protein